MIAMKYSFKNLLIAAAGLLLISSCKKVENEVVFLGGNAPTLTATQSQSTVINLAAGTRGNVALNFSWTNPDYKFNTGVSSQNVNYTLQIDTVGANFSSSLRQEISFSSDLSATITQDQLNKILLQMNLPFDQVVSFEVRLKSFLGTNSVALYSNVLTFQAVPFLDVLVALPTSGELYIVGGDPLLGGWQNGGTFASQNQQFNRDDLTTFSITVNLSGGDNTTDKDQYLFVPVWGSWSHKYACSKIKDQPVTGGKFGFDFSDNFPGPSAPGQYKIVVDFKLGTYSVTKL